jgi:hypothetical protein
MPDALTRALTYGAPVLVVGILVAFFLGDLLTARKQEENNPIPTYHEQLEIAKTGAPATARVVTMRQTNEMINGNPLVEATLEVQGPRGVYPVQTRQVIPLMNIPSFQPGATVSVRVDLQRRDHIAVVF